MPSRCRAAPTAWPSACSPSAGRAPARGRVSALIVDHGLRPESGAEALEVAAWLERRGIHHRILVWRGPKPATGIQAAAREARYALLGDWCREAGVLHLLLGHHRDDQAETVALRAARRSGPDGLAGMAPVREIAGLRLLRPLLAVPKARLLATLRAAGQAWIEDPSNRAPRFARARLRQSPLDAVDVAGRATARAVLDRRTAAWLAAMARIDPAGFVAWPRTALAEAPPEVARRALQQALAAVGGGAYSPRSARLDRLLEALLAAPGVPGRTLAGCRILAWGDESADLPRGGGDRAAAAARPERLAPLGPALCRALGGAPAVERRCRPAADRAGARGRRVACMQGPGLW